jgi:putative glutamine amidotransferase
MIDTDIEHMNNWKETVRTNPSQCHHRITMDSESRFSALFGLKPFMVNSYHHQAVRDVPEGFAVSARSDDGIIEGVERSDRDFVFAAQCHFEFLWEYDSRWFEVYGRFIAASQRYAG